MLNGAGNEKRTHIYGSAEEKLSVVRCCRCLLLSRLNTFFGEWLFSWATSIFSGAAKNQEASQKSVNWLMCASAWGKSQLSHPTIWRRRLHVLNQKTNPKRKEHNGKSHNTPKQKSQLKFLNLIFHTNGKFKKRVVQRIERLTRYLGNNWGYGW